MFIAVIGLWLCLAGHMLGMSYEAIGRSLNIGRETARKACHNKASLKDT